MNFWAKQSRSRRAVTLQYKGSISRDGTLKTLEGGISLNALHSAEHEIHPPSSPQAIQDLILSNVSNWIRLESSARPGKIMWIHGPHRSGKTWLARTIAQRLEESGTRVASFFFNKSDPTRNTAGYLIPTLIFQLNGLFPAFSDLLATVITNDPLIFGRSLELQLEKLLFEPFSRLHSEDLLIPDPSLIVIDGLDQCDHIDTHCGIVRTLVSMLQKYPGLPLLFIIASGAHSRLSLEFSAHSAMRVPVEDMYISQDNIYKLIYDGLIHLRQTHSRKLDLDGKWPSPEVIQEFVSRASGHTLYVSTVLNHLSHSKLHPAEHLESLMSLVPSHSRHGLAELDALYCHIINSSSSVQTVIHVLHHTLYGNLSSIRDIESLMYLEVGSVPRILSEMKAIVAYANDSIAFHHPSLADFLMDSTRCEHLYTDPGEVHARLAHTWFEQIHSFGYDRPPVKYRVKCFLHHLKHAKPTKEVYRDILRFHPNIAFELSAPRAVTVTQMSDFLRAVRVLGFDDAQELYVHHLKRIYPIVKVYFPEYHESFCKFHDTSILMTG